MHLIQSSAALALFAVSLLAAPAEARKHPYVYSHTYTNIDGHQVHRPVRPATAPPGWTAQCRDWTYSFSEHHRGTCSHQAGSAAGDDSQD